MPRMYTLLEKSGEERVGAVSIKSYNSLEKKKQWNCGDFKIEDTNNMEN